MISYLNFDSCYKDILIVYLSVFLILNVVPVTTYKAEICGGYCYRISTKYVVNNQSLDLFYQKYELMVTWEQNCKFSFLKLENHIPLLACWLGIQVFNHLLFQLIFWDGKIQDFSRLAQQFHVRFRQPIFHDQQEAEDLVL